MAGKSLSQIEDCSCRVKSQTIWKHSPDSPLENFINLA